ncbi:hypothetical protein LTR84_010369 [Exophiala bonariae]|uniref:Uncharacterized protein n=1 Tax=Exophiala bonariae TaxID=1690606 RepID=A0AAV9MTA3_9EURO|nr:hypothetical protein LTR84_010369 [Exophiala bonariae]
MPYFAIESGAFLESRQNEHSGKQLPSFEAMSARSKIEALRFHYMSELAKEYGPESKVREQTNTIQLPQTLDQSHFAADQPLLEQDMDQVLYRYTVKREKAKAKLLMVNQLWLWKIDNLVVTAFPEPWTDNIESTLRHNLGDAYIILREGRIPRQGDEGMDPEDFVSHIIRQCTTISGQPGYGGLGETETWATIFSKSISEHGALETRRYKEFVDYVHDISNNNSNPGQSSALYDIYQETDGLRQVRDVRDELKMIRAVWENQKAVEDKLAWKYAYPLLSPPDWFASNVLDFTRLDEEAQGVEKRFNQLLDLKQQEASLSLAREADRRDRDAERRDRENEKQSQLLFAFTVITVIFTPLNFVAAFMAIPTRQFPHQGDNVSWNWWQTFVGMLIAEIVSVPTIWFAVQSTQLQELFRAIWANHGNAEARPAEEDEGLQPSKPDSSLV